MLIEREAWILQSVLSRRWRQKRVLFASPTLSWPVMLRITGLAVTAHPRQGAGADSIRRNRVKTVDGAGFQPFTGGLCAYSWGKAPWSLDIPSWDRRRPRSMPFTFFQIYTKTGSTYRIAPIQCLAPALGPPASSPASLPDGAIFWPVAGPFGRRHIRFVHTSCCLAAETHVNDPSITDWVNRAGPGPILNL
jgi:hypothetical protein